MARPSNKRSLTIARHRTSVSLEDEFWDALVTIARADGKSVAALVGEIDKRRSAQSKPAAEPIGGYQDLRAGAHARRLLAVAKIDALTAAEDADTLLPVVRRFRLGGSAGGA